MKKILITVILMLAATSILVAQQKTVEKRFSTSNNQTLTLELKYGASITIEACDRNEINFAADVEINGGRLNELLKFTFDEQSNQLAITTDFNLDQPFESDVEDCPDQAYSTNIQKNDDKKVVRCSDINYKLFVPANINIAVESISADIELINFKVPIQAKSIGGFVDLSWPDGNPADFELKTISGEAFTDIEGLQFPDGRKTLPIVGYNIEAMIGGNGPQVSLESVSGNIYLRQTKS